MPRTRPRFKNCIISAPFETNLSAVKDALGNHGVNWRWAEAQLISPYPPPAELRGIIRGVDIAIVVLSDGDTTHQIFAAGVAIGLGKPVVLIETRSSRNVDIGLNSIPTVFAEINDFKSIQSQLGRFLLSLNPPYWTRPSALRRQSSPAEYSKNLHVEDFNSAFEYEIISLFARFSELVESSPRLQGNGDWQPDALVWIRGLDPEVALPIAVEVKAVDSEAAITNTVSNLASYLTNLGLPYGVAVFNGDRELSCAVARGAFVFVIGSDPFERLVETGQFVSKLVDYRNRVLHRDSTD